MTTLDRPAGTTDGPGVVPRHATTGGRARPDITGARPLVPDLDGEVVPAGVRPATSGSGPAGGIGR